MTLYSPQNSDIEKFANHLGLDGLDVDSFYEMYYNLVDEDDDYDAQFECQLNSTNFT